MTAYPYRCAAGHVNKVARPEVEASKPIRCPDCGLEAQRLVHLGGFPERPAQ